jgi:hypothetical protein
MASSLSLLAWGGIEYSMAYEKSGQRAALLDVIRWGADWLIKAHPSDNVFYAQVGNGAADHSYWGPSETMTMARPAYAVTVAKPGSDVAAEAAAAMALIENIQREDLNPLEEAQGLQRLIKEFGLTHETAAQAVGRSRSAASNLLRLLNLADPVQSMLMAGDLDMGHARALLSLDKAAQITAANQIAAKKLSVREAESLAKKLGAEFNLVHQKPKKEKSRDIRRVEEELSDLLMAEVEVRVKKRVKRLGKIEEMGELSIQFGSLDELNGLIDKLRG